MKSQYQRTARVTTKRCHHVKGACAPSGKKNPTRQQSQKLNSAPLKVANNTHIHFHRYMERIFCTSFPH